MSPLAALPRLPGLPVALPPVEAPATGLPTATASDAAFEAILFEVRALVDEQLAGKAPGTLPDLDTDADTSAPAETIPEQVLWAPQTHAQDEPVPAVPISGHIAFAPVAAPELPEIPEVATDVAAGAEPRADEPRVHQPAQPAQPADPAPLGPAPSLVNLVLGTAAVPRDAEPGDPEASDAVPTPRAAAEPRYPAHAISPRTTGEPHGGGDPERESQPAAEPQRETRQASRAVRPPAAHPQEAPVSDPAAALDPLPRSGAQAEASLRAAQGSLAIASDAPIPVEPSPAHHATTAPRAPRALPERPAHGEVEVVRAEPAARTEHFQSLEPLGRGPERESHPAAAPQRETTQDPPASRAPAADPQAAPVSDSSSAVEPLPRSGAQADSALRAAQVSVAVASGAPTPVELGPVRDASAAPLASRVLPELPARSEVEVLHSVRVLAEQGGGRVQVRLEPPELGGLSLRVVVSNGAVHVSMLADQPPVADLLQRHSAELRSALENHGLRLDQLDVGTGDAGLGSRDAHPREPDERGATGGRALVGRHLGTVLPLRRFDVSTLGAVDLHV